MLQIQLTCLAGSVAVALGYSSIQWAAMTTLCCVRQASEAEARASSAEAETEELQEAAASSGSTIEQWQAAYADLQQQQDTAVAELQQLREAAGGTDSSIEEWRNAYADLQQQCSSLQVCHAAWTPWLTDCSIRLFQLTGPADCSKRLSHRMVSTDSVDCCKWSQQWC